MWPKYIGKIAQFIGNVAKIGYLIEIYLIFWILSPNYIENFWLERKNNALIKFLDHKNMGIDTKSNTFCKIAHIQKKITKNRYFTEKVSHFEL